MQWDGCCWIPPLADGTGASKGLTLEGRGEKGGPVFHLVSVMHICSAVGKILGGCLSCCLHPGFVMGWKGAMLTRLGKRNVPDSSLVRVMVTWCLSRSKVRAVTRSKRACGSSLMLSAGQHVDTQVAAAIGVPLTHFWCKGLFLPYTKFDPNSGGAYKTGGKKLR